MSLLSAPFLKGILLGFGAAAPLGPVNVQIARRTLHDGFFAGFFLGCGAVTVDVIYAIVSSFSVGHFAQDRRIILPITFAGVGLLTYLGIQCIRAGLRPAGLQLTPDAPDQSPAQTSVIREPVLKSFLTGVLMTLLNPMTLAFWFIAVPAIASDLSHAVVDSRTLGVGGVAPEVTGPHLPIICAGVFVATLTWVCFFAGLLSIARKRRRDGWLRIADLSGGAMLLCMAGATLWRSIRAFL